MDFDTSTARCIIAEGDVDLLIRTAENVGSDIARQLTTSQIRNIFGEVRRIGMNWDSDPAAGYRSTMLLIPKLAYQAAREKGRGTSVLANILTPCLNEIRHCPQQSRKLYFDRFADFFEAILAYHKAAGGN